MTRRTPDVAIVGGGIIGMATALACVGRGLSVVICGEALPGAASAAAAGMLSPSTESAAPNAHAFAVACRDSWPAYLAELATKSRTPVDLNRLGILEVAVDATDAARTQRGCTGDSCWLDAKEVMALEPALHAPCGAAHHRRDGAVDNEQLLIALDEAIATSASITWRPAARRLELAVDTGTLVLADRSHVRAHRVVLAAGAWVNQLAGLPRPLPVTPVRGQMIGYRGAPLRHAVIGHGAYLVPRPGGRTIVGATSETVGFDAGTTAEAAAGLAAAAARIVPAIERLTLAEHWSGLRPMTRDLLPIIGPDPDHPVLLYGCGHSRNGVLMTPLTALCLAALATGDPSPWPLAPFSVTRFS